MIYVLKPESLENIHYLASHFEQGAFFCKKRSNLRNFLRHFSFNIVLIENYSRILHKQFDPFEDRHKNIFLNRKRFRS